MTAGEDYSELPLSFILSASGAFASHAAELLLLDVEIFSAAVDALKGADAFAGRDAARDSLAIALPEESARKAFWSYAWNITKLARGHDTFLSEFRWAASEAIKDLSDEKLDELVDRTRAILEAKPDVLLLQQKAERLGTATGCSLVSCTFVSDLRPVFDNERTDLRALIPVTTMRLIHRAPGCRSAVDIVLSESQLRRLSSEVAIAEAKLDLLKQHVQNPKPVPIPRVGMTDEGDQE